MIFYTWKDAEGAFETQMGVLSDDSDAEESRFMRWLEDNGHQVFEDDPTKETDRENARGIFPIDYKHKDDE